MASVASRSARCPAACAHRRPLFHYRRSARDPARRRRDHHVLPRDRQLVHSACPLHHRQLDGSRAVLSAGTRLRHPHRRRQHGPRYRCRGRRHRRQAGCAETVADCASRSAGSCERLSRLAQRTDAALCIRRCQGDLRRPASRCNFRSREGPDRDHQIAGARACRRSVSVAAVPWPIPARHARRQPQGDGLPPAHRAERRRIQSSAPRAWRPEARARADVHR